MNIDRSLAREWAAKLTADGDTSAEWSAIRAAIVSAFAAQLPRMLATLRWMIEAELRPHPKLQRMLERWIEAESKGHDRGAPPLPKELAEWKRANEAAGARHEESLQAAREWAGLRSGVASRRALLQRLNAGRKAAGLLSRNVERSDA